ncbi:MAG: hypothetical protein CTY26_05840, partial [Methylophilus sp.]
MAIVVDTNGNRHMLKIGEALHAGDKVITASGAIVSVKLANGEVVNIAEAQTVKITDNLAQVDVSDVTENAVNQAVFDAVLTALNEGRDITEVLEDPAAGAAGSDGNATFVNLDRIQTQGPSSATYDGGNGFVGGPTQGGIPPNFVFLTPASGAPGVSLEGDVNNDGYLNKNELALSGNPGFTNARVTLPAGMEPGDVVNLTHNTGTINRPLTGTDIANGFVTISVPVPAEGDTLVVTATITNQSGQTSPPNSDSAIIDGTPPNANAIKGELPETVKDDTGISQTDNITSNRQPTLIGTTEKVTDTVTVNVDGKDYTATVSAGPNGTAIWKVDLTGANLKDAVYTPTITVKDLAGNETTKPSETFTVDGTAPDLSKINGELPETVKDDTGFSQTDNYTNNRAPTLIGTTEKATDSVVITVDGKDYVATVSAGPNGTGIWSVNLTGAQLADGTYTPTIKVTDLAGNSSTKNSETFIVDGTPPDASKISGQLPETIKDDTGASQTDNYTNNRAPTLTGTTEKVSDRVVITIDGKDYVATVTAGPNSTAVWTVDLTGAALPSGTYTPVITVTDQAGNSTVKNSETFTVDIDAPALTIILDQNIAGDGIINIAESNAAAIPVTGNVTGDYKAGDIVTLTVNGKEFTGAVAANGSFSINVPGADLAADADRTVEAKITVVDNAGNSTTASDTQAYAVALTPPALAISLDANVAGDGIVNITESTAAAIPVTGTVSGQFKVGDVVTVTVNGKNFTGTVQAGGKFSINVPGADLAADSDKTIDAKVSTTDIAGNTSTATDTQDYTVNLLPPALAISLDANVAGDGIVNAAESTAASIPVTGTVSGQFKVGDTVTLTINNKTFTGSVLDGGKFSIGVPGADLAADADSTVFASVTTTNAAGNSATATDTQTYTVNTAPPAVAISLDANVAGDGIVNVAESTAAAIPVTGTVSGQFKAGDIVTVTINGKDFTGAVATDGTFSINVPGADLAADPDSTVFASVTTTNAAGNSATATDTQDYKLAINPNLFATIALDANFAGDGIINIEEAKSTTTIAVTGTVGGDAELGDPVVVTINNKEYATTVITRADGKLGFSVNVAGSELAADVDKTIDAKVTVSDNAGNSLSQSTQLTYTVDLTPPKAEIALDANFGGDGIINIEEAKATSITPVTGTVGGDAKLGDPVVVTINNKDYATTVITRPDGKLGFSVNVAGNELVADADKTIDARVTVTDNAGNTASQSTQLTYSLDLTPPKAEIALDANFGGDGIINIEEAKATS